MDFNYNNTTVITSGGTRPSTRNTPGDVRLVVDVYSDIFEIPYPYVGMSITVKSDETNDGKMTDYKVLSLKENFMGIADMAVNEIKRMDEYIGVNSSSEGLTVEQAQQLQDAYNHSQSPHVQTSDIPAKVSELENDINFVTRTEMTEAINKAQLGGSDGSDIDLSIYQPIEESTLTTTAKTIPTAINELKGGLDAIKLPTKVSELENDSNYLTTIPEEYVTETELNDKGYLTSHQDISGLQTKTDDNLVTSNKTIIGAINEVKLTMPTRTSRLENDSGFITSIPEEYVTETELDDKGYLTSHQDISGLQTKTDDDLTTTNKTVVGAINELKTGMDSSSSGSGLTTEQANQLATAYNHSQSTHVQASDIPTKVSELENDSNYLINIPEEYITETELNNKGYLTSHQDISGLQSKTDNNLNTTNKTVTDAINEVKASVDSITVPTKVSELENDSKYITSIPEEYITETELEDKGYLTSHQDISGLQSKTDNSLATTNKTVAGAINEVKASVDSITVPTKVSELKNDSNYLTNIPEEYITETELNNKGYLTTHQDISTLQTKTDNSLTTTNKTVVGAINELKTGMDSTAAGSGLTTEQANQLATAYEHSQSTHVQASDIPTKVSELENDSKYITNADIPVIPTKTSNLENDSGFITSIPEEYVTETELNAKGYLTTHQDISNLQTKTDNSLTTTNKTVVGAINELKTNMGTGSGYSFSGSYNDLTDKPTIPAKTSQLTNDSGFISSPDVIVVNKGNVDTEVDLDNDIPLGGSTILLTGLVVYQGYDHELLSVYRDPSSSNAIAMYSMRGNKITLNKSNNKWSITSSTSFIDRENANNIYQKKNDSTLTTTDKTVPGAINELKGGLDKIKVPTKVSELENDSNYLTNIPEEYVTETELEDKGYLTSHQDISGLQAKTDNSLTTTNKTVVGAINELKTNMGSGSGSSFSGNYNDLTNKPTIPTKTSQLTNDSGFLDTTNVIIVNKGDANEEVDLDNDIPTGKNVILLTGTVVQVPYDNELVYVNKSSSVTIYSMRGNKLFAIKSGGMWLSAENVNFIYETGLVNSLTTKAKTIPGGINELKKGLDAIKVPTKVSELENDSKYITSIPEEYVTETELENKGYLTSHQDISSLQTKTDSTLTTTNKTVVGAINELKTNISNINTDVSRVIKLTSASTINLSKDKYQSLTPTSETTISLPELGEDEFKEIHLVVTEGETAYNLIFSNSNLKWQNGETITLEANKIYEYIFTFISGNWLVGVVMYS